MDGVKILIVEDEGVEALNMQRRLKTAGFSASEIVMSGEEAVQKAADMRPDLVLMDIMLNGSIDGIQAAELIRSAYDIPVIYVTAYADEGTLKRAKITEPYGYIVKPYRDREILIAIEMAIYKHKVEKETREREKWFSTTLKSIADAVIATDKNGSITFMNAAAERLTGWMQDELLGARLTDVFKIVNSKTGQPVENAAAKVLTRGTAVGSSGCTVLIAKDGREVPIDESAAPIKDDSGNIVGIILVFHDVTERERAEEELRKSNDQLEKRVAERTSDLVSMNKELNALNQSLALARDEALQASKFKSDFVARTSHELRTPISAVIGLLELVLVDDNSLDDETTKVLDLAYESATSLLSIVNEMLDLYKIEAGKVALEKKEFVPVSLVEGAADVLAQDSRRKSLPLRTVFDPNLPPLLEGDPVKLHQILVNLIANAVRFTEVGEIVVKATVDDDDGSCVRVRFAVTDTGIGLSETDIPKLFQPLVQVGTRKAGGTGLGLSICKHLVDIMDGKVGVESKEGEGSTFWFSVPLKRPDMNKVAGFTPGKVVSTTTAEVELSSPTVVSADDDCNVILVVDDDETLRQLFQMQLRKLGASVHTAANGREAVEAMSRTNYALILMDLQMPLMDGIEAARCIRTMEKSTGNHVPIVAITAHAMAGTRERCFASGMDDFLIKPIDVMHLKTMLSRWL